MGNNLNPVNLVDLDGLCMSFIKIQLSKIEWNQLTEKREKEEKIIMSDKLVSSTRGLRLMSWEWPGL